jgi:hypothetical protein
MQYKQVPRIALEIHDAPETPEEVRVPALHLLSCRRRLPKLGPYRKRSLEQALWRMASDSQLGGAVRWKALKPLLQMRAPTEITAQRLDVRTERLPEPGAPTPDVGVGSRFILNINSGK